MKQVDRTAASAYEGAKGNHKMGIFRRKNFNASFERARELSSDRYLTTSRTPAYLTERSLSPWGPIFMISTSLAVAIFIGIKVFGL